MIFKQSKRFGKFAFSHKKEKTKISKCSFLPKRRKSCMVQRKNLKKHFLFLKFFSLCMSADSPLIAREEIGCRQSRDATISTLPSIQPKPNQRYSGNGLLPEKKHALQPNYVFLRFFHPPWVHRAHGSVLPALSRILHIPPGGRVEVQQQENFTSIIEIKIR